MDDILTKRNQRALADCAYSSVLLAFDFDGAWRRSPRIQPTFECGLESDVCFRASR